MKRDLIYWRYIAKAIVESVEYLTEEERKLAIHNANLLVANKMAKSGHSAHEIGSFLETEHPAYQSHMLNAWYRSGGDVPVLNFIRASAIKAFGIDSTKVHAPKFESSDIHPNVIHPSMVDFLHRVHKLNISNNSSLPEHLIVYRGVGLAKQTQPHEYVPHAVESWTTDLDSAKKFSRMSHMPGAIPHVFKANIIRDHILLSHTAHSKLGGIVPPEHELVGKEEHLVFGDKLHNIERVE